MKTDAASRAKQLECPHPGYAIKLACSGPSYYRCDKCGLVVPSVDVAFGVHGGSTHGESAISRRAAERIHDGEDLREAMDAMLLEQHGYTPGNGNPPPYLGAIRWEFQKKWPGIWGRIARGEEF